jgi:hypothetical protein
MEVKEGGIMSLVKGQEQIIGALPMEEQIVEIVGDLPTEEPLSKQTPDPP